MCRPIPAAPVTGAARAARAGPARGAARRPACRDMEEVRTTSCPNCGAQVEFTARPMPPNARSARRRWCWTPAPAPHQAAGLVPFVLTEPQARKAMIAWLGSLWFAPGTGLLEYARKGRAMNGVYVPFWTFDADTRQPLSRPARRVLLRDPDRHGPVNGRTRTAPGAGAPHPLVSRLGPGGARFRRRAGDGLHQPAAPAGQRADALGPGRAGALRPEYLAGFQAEGYTVPLPTAMPRRGRMAT
jgi:hypothetical protein